MLNPDWMRNENPIPTRHISVEHMYTLPNTLELPDRLSIVGIVDGTPSAGLLILLTVKMLRKNHYTILLGPTLIEGVITTTKKHLESEMSESRDQFPMDYKSMPFFAGELIVGVMSLTQIESAMRAYDLFHSHLAYPPDYRDTLATAWSWMYANTPKRVDVQSLSCRSPARFAFSPSLCRFDLHALTRSAVGSARKSSLRWAGR